MIATRKKTVKNAKKGKIAENFKNDEKSKYLDTYLTQVSYI